VKKKSAGLIMYRFKGKVLEVLLGHMGGPFWAKKDEGAWSIPKGVYENTEDPFAAAQREFKEETGFEPEGNYIELQTLKQPDGKEVKAWAFESDCDPSMIRSNTFELEWPPRSGKISQFPEIDRARWFPTNLAKTKILIGQRGFIDELCEKLEYDSGNERNGFCVEGR
jgi:predicted NUDIX family NTP pyrophosphohydrolase